MIRVKAAYLQQILHFVPEDDSEAAKQALKEEVAQYKAQLVCDHIPHCILSETPMPNGSVVMEIKMQHDDCPVGMYLNI